MMKPEDIYATFRAGAHSEAEAKIREAKDEAKESAEECAKVRAQLAEARQLRLDAEQKLEQSQNEATSVKNQLEETSQALKKQDDECAAAVAEATQAVAKARGEDRFTEFLIVGGIAAASLFVGMFIQRKWDVRIPWISGVGIIALIAGAKLPLETNPKRAALGVGAGLTLAGGVVFAIDYFPALKKH